MYRTIKIADQAGERLRIAWTAGEIITNDFHNDNLTFY